MKITEETLKTVRTIFDTITFCEECQHREKHNKFTNGKNGYFCKEFGGNVTKYDFCSRGVEK